MSNIILDLFRGVGVIIDDALKSEKETAGDRIWEIKKSFDDMNIPLLIYDKLPDNDKVKNFISINFLLLDWNLTAGLEPGIYLPQSEINANITFIKQFNTTCFAPIFIFSNESEDEIKTQLRNAGLYNNTQSNNIFVKPKADFKDNDLFAIIEEWVKQTPSIYVLKEWELSIQKAKNSLFWDFYHINPEWAKVLYETINKDGGDLSYEMSEILFENLKTRTLPVKFNDSILSASDTATITSDADKIESSEIKQVLEGQRFRKHNLDDMIFTGDIFLKDNKYFVNVRPQCDCIPREEQTIDDVNLYLIEGEMIDLSSLKEKSKLKLIGDSEISNSVIFPINGGNVVKFDFRKVTIEQFKDRKQDRVGTLLPPFITRLIQKFTSYMQRQGLPRIPENAIK